MAQKKATKNWGGVTWEGYVDVNLLEGQKGELKEYLRDDFKVLADLDNACNVLGYKVAVGRSPDGHGFRATLTGQEGGRNPGWTLCGYGSSASSALGCALYKDAYILKHVWPTTRAEVNEDYFR